MWVWIGENPPVLVRGYIRVYGMSVGGANLSLLCVYISPSVCVSVFRSVCASDSPSLCEFVCLLSLFVRVCLWFFISFIIA